MPGETITKCKCLKCGHEWWPRREKVYQCANPKCRTVHWDDYEKPSGEPTTKALQVVKDE